MIEESGTKTEGPAPAIASNKGDLKAAAASFAHVYNNKLDNILLSLSLVADAAAFTVEARQRLLALALTDQADEFEAPAAAAYKGQSGEIIEVLKDMKEKADPQLAELRKVEETAKHNYDMPMQSLEAQISAVKQYLKEATSRPSCMTVGADHEMTVKARAEELKVIAEAKTILMETTSGASDQTYSLFQVTVNSRLQTRYDLAHAEMVVLVKAFWASLPIY